MLCDKYDKQLKIKEQTTGIILLRKLFEYIWFIIIWTVYSNKVYFMKQVHIAIHTSSYVLKFNGIYIDAGLNYYFIHYY